MSDGILVIAGVILLLLVPQVFVSAVEKKLSTAYISKNQKIIQRNILIYSRIICFPFFPFLCSYATDSVNILIEIHKPSIVILLLITLIYICIMLKVTFMLATFHKYGLFFTKIFLCSLPFVFFLEGYVLELYSAITGKGALKTFDDYVLFFCGVNIFSLPYLLYFTFSKKIKAAWLDTAIKNENSRVEP